MAWEFNPEGFSLLIPADCLPTIQLTSGCSKFQSAITHYDCNKAHKTVGNKIALSLQMDNALNKFYLCISHYSRRIVTSSLTCRKTWIAYHAVFTPGITYTLPISFHSKKSLKKIKSAAICATLTKF